MLLSYQLRVGRTVPGGSPLDVDDVLLGDLLACERMNPVLLDNLVHALLRDDVSAGPEHGALAGVVEDIARDRALVPLLLRDEALLVVRVPHVGPLHLSEVLHPDWFSGDGAVDGFIRLLYLTLLCLRAHAGHPKGGKLSFPLFSHVADAPIFFVIAFKCFSSFCYNVLFSFFKL